MQVNTNIVMPEVKKIMRNQDPELINKLFLLMDKLDGFSDELNRYVNETIEYADDREEISIPNNSNF